MHHVTWFCPLQEYLFLFEFAHKKDILTTLQYFYLLCLSLNELSSKLLFNKIISEVMLLNISQICLLLDYVLRAFINTFQD